MFSIGGSLKPGEVISHWRNVNWRQWTRLVFATFIVPPALALFAASVLRLSGPETLGLFLVGVAPGAPLLTRNLARRGFDMHLAASYQLWAGLVTPIMLPAVVFAAGKMYNRDIWIPPADLLQQLGLKQFLPLALGLLFAWRIPQLAQRIQPRLNAAGNLLFLIAVVLLLLKLGPALKAVHPLVVVGALIVGLGSMAVVRLMRIPDPIRKTFAVCNANRHCGLALLLSLQFLNARNAIPAITVYALLAPVLILGYAKYYRMELKAEAAAR